MSKPRALEQHEKIEEPQAIQSNAVRPVHFFVRGPVEFVSSSCSLEFETTATIEPHIISTQADIMCFPTNQPYFHFFSHDTWNISVRGPVENFELFLIFVVNWISNHWNNWTKRHFHASRHHVFSKQPAILSFCFTCCLTCAAQITMKNCRSPLQPSSGDLLLLNIQINIHECLELPEFDIFNAI